MINLSSSNLHPDTLLIFPLAVIEPDGDSRVFDPILKILENYDYKIKFYLYFTILKDI